MTKQVTKRNISLYSTSIEDIHKADLETLQEKVELEGTNKLNKLPSEKLALLAFRLARINKATGGEGKEKKTRMGAASEEEVEINDTEDDFEENDVAKEMYERNPDLKIMRDDMVRQFRKAFGAQDRKIDRVE